MDACLAFAMCPILEKVRSNVALLVGMQKYFLVSSATEGNMREDRNQQARELVFWEVHPFKGKPPSWRSITPIVSYGNSPSIRYHRCARPKHGHE